MQRVGRHADGMLRSSERRRGGGKRSELDDFRLASVAVGDAFPMHREPLLARWLESECARLVDRAVAEVSVSGGTEDAVVAVVHESLRSERIKLGSRFYDDESWRRQMTASEPELGLLRQGVRPGEVYVATYDVYRIEIESGARLITKGANGGPFVDPMFMFVDGGHVVLRAANDGHRENLLRELDEHVERANEIVDRWNSVGLPEAVQRAVTRHRRSTARVEERAGQRAAAGFLPRSTRDHPERGEPVSARPVEAEPRQLESATGSVDEFQSPDAARAANPSSRQVRTALISWSHHDPGFTAARIEDRATNAALFANALRLAGVDADIDLFHQHEGVDWTRWGPGRMQEVDFVLVLPSEGWSRAWAGHSSAGAGATAEADVLHSLFQHDRQAFDRRVRLVTLPGEPTVVPPGLDRVVRRRVASFDAGGLEDLLRDLTGQPSIIPAPLGPGPVLPPLTPADSMRMSRIAAHTPHGDLEIQHPEQQPTAIQRVIDDFVASEQRSFEQNEAQAAALAGSGLAANQSSILFSLEMDSGQILSYVAACSYVLPGAAISYQRSVGFAFRRDDGTELCMSDVLVDEPGNLPLFGERFVSSARHVLGVDRVTVTGVPSGATLAVRPNELGVCTARYDVGPGYLGAPVVWIPHDAISRIYQPWFARLLRLPGG